MEKMKANVLRGVNSIGIGEVEHPGTGANETVIRFTLTTKCCD